ncbi:MAG TPA: amidase [Usitatibacter sp.]|jgi:aspartyl-tRNA(Asn)/glutamyl-tRNA(Gln) amidotransferase subunit A|nr:amidase [Usitatibacter sp.]
MSMADDGLEQALVVQAKWQGYSEPGRARSWRERIELNQPEIDALRAAAVPQVAPHVPRAASVALPAAGPAPRIDRRLTPETALANAHAKAALRAFTFLPGNAGVAVAGYLRGAPVAVKDLMGVRDWPLSGGGRAMGRPPAAADAAVVARIRAAGGVPMGLTNLHEFAYGITSDNPHFGRVVNPASDDRIPGGSSGGSAAAIAAGIVRHAIGTDTSGSIRIPAACCGVVGLKPSYDAVPRAGVIDLAYSLDHVGPMARTVDECAELFAAMCALDPVPPWRLDDLRARRVGILTGYFAEPLDADVARAVAEAAAALRQDGARVEETTIEGAALTPAIQLQTIAAEATAFHLDRLRDNGAAFGEDVRVRLETGLFFPAAWYAKAQRLRAAWAAALDAAFERHDVLLCATLRVPAPRIGTSRVDVAGRSIALHTAITGLTLPFNLPGVPALALPWSSTASGVPLSVQLVARRGGDWDLLGVARRLEAASAWQEAHRLTP